jgi:curli production assembly/transport component CsgG/holdfast attachment protein HfaB
MTARPAPLAILAAIPAVCVAACLSAFARPSDVAPVTANPTPWSPALTCLGARGHWQGGSAPRIAVGRIADQTGRIDLYSGTPNSQGASLFAVTALMRAGVPVVERLDNTVAEIELSYARQHLLSDTPERAGTSGDNFRPILAGQIAGSRYYIIGGVTELNYNIASSGVQLQVGGSSSDGPRAQAGSSRYVMNVAVDLRLVDTRSQEVLDSVSFQKQVVGAERGIGLSGSGSQVEGLLNGGTGAMEPLQFAVRTIIERGVFELLAGLQSRDPRPACLPAGPGGAL